jgi:hypothetical protein
MYIDCEKVHAVLTWHSNPSIFPSQVYMDWAPGGGPVAPRQLALLVTALSSLFVCLLCRRCFSSATGLHRHYQASGHDATFAPVLPPMTAMAHVRRFAYTFRQKRDYILDVQRLLAEWGAGEFYAKKAREVIARRSGVSPSNLAKWVKDKEFIFACARTRRLGGKKRFRPSDAKWPYAELQLYVRFIYRRRYQALRVTKSWLRTTFKDIRHNLGEDVRQWYPSSGWCSRFCKRWEITSQCRTNKKKFSIEERLDKIQAFHQFWILGVQHGGVQRCPKYGRFPASHIYAMDQVPMPFSSPSKRSMNEKGSRRGNRFTAASEDDKRFCTLQVCLCADSANQDVAIELIFRSGSDGAFIPDEEKQLYENDFPDVKIRWQSKAWADENICIEFMTDFRRQTLAKGEVALVLDNLGSQQTPMIRAIMHFLDIKAIFLPANCTDCVSPVDRNIGQWIKQRAYQIQEAELDKPENRHWPLPTKKGGLTAAQKRKLIVRWVNQAWSEMKVTRQHCINKAFVDSGILIAKDRSEDVLIRLRPGDPEGTYTY